MVHANAPQDKQAALVSVTTYKPIATTVAVVPKLVLPANSVSVAYAKLPVLLAKQPVLQDVLTLLKTETTAENALIPAPPDRFVPAVSVSYPVPLDKPIAQASVSTSKRIVPIVVNALMFARQASPVPMQSARYPALQEPLLVEVPVFRFSLIPITVVAVARNALLVMSVSRVNASSFVATI